MSQRNYGPRRNAHTEHQLNLLTKRLDSLEKNMDYVKEHVDRVNSEKMSKIASKVMKIVYDSNIPKSTQFEVNNIVNRGLSHATPRDINTHALFTEDETQPTN